MTDLFVYGTLLNRELTEDMLGHSIQTYSEILPDFKKVGLNIVESPGNKVYGATFEVSKEDLKRLDVYEGVEQGHYKRIHIVLESGKKAIAYQVVK